LRQEDALPVNTPYEKQRRLVLNTDAKNEADDQYAIVHALLTPSFDIRGIIPAHFGSAKTDRSLQESHDEVMLLLDLMGMTGQVRVDDGAPHALPDERTPVPSPGALLIIEEAMSDDARPLQLLFIGPLTDMASALLMEPRIAERPAVVVWLGGGMWPEGGWEFNLSNDIAAANIVFRSGLKLTQVPMNAFMQTSVSYAELYERVYPQGDIGKYLVEQLVARDEAVGSRFWEFHVLCDSAAFGVTLNPLAGTFEWQPAPEFTPQMSHNHTGANRAIRVYNSIDSRFIFEDFFAKLTRFGPHVSNGNPSKT
jgi:inosine-uridine nucleoside N-ribohydrolase